MKDFVLDTNVILHDSRAIFLFEENNVLIPMTVVEELDTFKKEMNELGRNARFFSKTIDELRAQGSVAEGVLVNNKGGLLRVVMCSAEALTHLPPEMDHNLPDNRILAVALHNQLHSENKTVLVSKDTNMRIKADALELSAENYENDRVDVEDLYTGILYLNSEDEIPPSDYLLPNQYIVVRDPVTGVIAKEGRYDQGSGEIVPLREDLTSWGLDPANDEQRYLMDLLLNDDIKLVTVSGKAGCGKTLISLSCALRKVTDEFVYRKLLVSRPVMPMGKDIGYLPGNIDEKYAPYLQPIKDNVEFLVSGSAPVVKPVTKKRSRKSRDEDEKEAGFLDNGYAELSAAGIMELEPLLYIRGRSIPNVVMLVDECVVAETRIVTSGTKGKNTVGHLYTMYKAKKELPLVKTYNEDKDLFEFKKIVKVVNKGEREIYQISAGGRTIKCTGNHPLLTAYAGWVRAEDLVRGDVLSCSEPVSSRTSLMLNDDQMQILIGSYLGDGGISETSYGVYRLNIGHCDAQKDYLYDKAKVLGVAPTFVQTNGYAQTPYHRLCSKTFALGGYAKIPSVKTTVPAWMIEQIDARGLAIWFQDDGSGARLKNTATLHTECFDDDTQQALIEMLQHKFGIEAYVGVTHRKDTGKTYRYLRLRKAGYEKLAKIIAPYTSKCMHYKIKTVPEESLNTYEWDSKYKTCGGIVITKIEKLPSEELVYDIQVEDNHNFIVCSQNGGEDLHPGGPILHNCQNLSPHEAKTIVTRAGKGTKLIFTGDVEQIDNNYLDSESNGLSYLIEKFKGQEIAGHVTLVKGERSELAEIATQIL